MEHREANIGRGFLPTSLDLGLAATIAGFAFNGAHKCRGNPDLMSADD